MFHFIKSPVLGVDDDKVRKHFHYQSIVGTFLEIKSSGPPVIFQPRLLRRIADITIPPIVRSKCDVDALFQWGPVNNCLLLRTSAGVIDPHQQYLSDEWARACANATLCLGFWKGASTNFSQNEWAAAR